MLHQWFMACVIRLMVGMWVILAGFAGLCSTAQAYAEIEGSRVDEIARMLPAKPGGFGPVCADRQAWSNPALLSRVQPVVAAADKLLSQPFPAWSDEAYLEYSLHGTRPNGERMMNARKAWLYPLVIAECARHDGRYLPAIRQTLEALITQPSWTWPAHDRGLRNFRRQDYEVDLLAADMAHDLAQALYMLGDLLDADTRQKTMTALEQRVFSPVRRTVVSGNRDNWWLHADHNWNAVCLKGVVAAALSVIPDVHDRAVFAAAGEHYILHYLKGFTAEGYTPEGPGYWNYGFSHFTVLREALYAASHGQLDLFATAKVREMALYGYRYEILPDNLAAFGDASPRTHFDPFTKTYANRVFDLKQSDFLENLPISASQPGNAAPLAETVLKLFANPQALPTPNAQVAIGVQSYFASVGVLISRPAPKDVMGIAIKAGGNANHSHNDIGSYTIAMANEQPVGDPGATVYSSKTFSKERYSIRGINSWGHPVPVVDGYLQREATKLTPRVLETKLGDNEDEILMDMSSAYDTPGISSLTRRMAHSRAAGGHILIEDRFVFLAPKTFEVAITTTGNWRDKGEGKLEFWQKQQHLLGWIEASAPYEIISEKVNEEGLAFSRLAIRLKAPQSTGYVRIHYAPASPDNQN